MRRTSVQITERGPIRPINADAVLADDVLGFYAVADGVGSTEASRRASATVVAAARDWFEHARQADVAYADLDLAAMVDEVFAAYSLALADLATRPSSTLTVVLISGARLRYVSVGDSPLFLIDGRRISLLTREHTLVDQSRIISNFSELKSQNGANVLTNAFGPRPPRATVYEDLDLPVPCRLVLCSDGLLEFVTQDELGALCAASATLADVLAAIGAAATADPPRDNYSGLIIDLAMKEPT